jgi:hypothetical protein
LSIGKTRSDVLNINFLEIIINFKFIFFIIAALIFLNIKIFLKKEKKYNEVFFIINCIIGTALIFIYSQLLTKNQILIFFLIPVLMAFFHSYYFLIFKKKYFLFFMISLTFFSVIKYHYRYNENKYFMDFNRFEIQYASEAEKIDKIFYRLKWLTPFDYYKKSSETNSSNTRVMEKLANSYHTSLQLNAHKKYVKSDASAFCYQSSYDNNRN